jgi:hypothetical protein
LLLFCKKIFQKKTKIQKIFSKTERKNVFFYFLRVLKSRTRCAELETGQSGEHPLAPRFRVDDHVLAFFQAQSLPEGTLQTGNEAGRLREVDPLVGAQFKLLLAVSTVLASASATSSTLAPRVLDHFEHAASAHARRAGVSSEIGEL